MDSAYTKTTYQNRLRLLEASPLLSTLPHGSLDSLARSAELVACSRQHRFYGPHDPVERRIPYLIVHGCVQVLYAEVARRDGTKLLGPGAVFGLEGAVKKTLGEAALDEEAATVNAWAEEPVWLLKLDFKRLKDPRPAIKGLWTRLERSTPRCTAALREFLLLRNLPHHVLQDLAIVSQRFDINEGIGHVKLLASTQPRSMLVVGGDLEADCLTGEEHEEPVTLRGGPGDLLALPPGARALKWIRSSASFLLSRTSELEKMAREVRPLHWAMARASGRNTADIILAMPDRRLEMDLACVRQLVRRLAAGMHDHVGDRATVVSLVEDTGLTVEEGQLPVDPHDLAASMAGAITEFWNKAQGPQPDVLLVDPTPLLGDRVKDLHVVRQLGFGIERVAEETPAGVVTSISYLFDQPGVWAEAWVDMGMPRETHFLPTVLLDPDPTDGTLASFLADARDDFDRRCADLKHSVGSLLPTSVRGRLRELVSDVVPARPGAGRQPAEPWPLTAVRLRVSRDVERTLAQDGGRPLKPAELAHLDAGLARWARALTGRRIALALGGAGVQSYCAIPFIEGLRKKGVPIDYVAGTSGGAYIAAFYAADPRGGMKTLIDQWWCAELGILLAWWDSAPLGWWATAATGGAKLENLEIPALTVATCADLGNAVLLRDGRVGPACTASGALPPTAPVFRGSARLLDGGLVMDVPTEVLFDCAAAMVVSVNAVPPVDEAIPVPVLPIPGYGLLLKLNPYLRWYDYYRAYLMLFNQAARIGEVYSDVGFSARFAGTNAGFFWQAHKVVEAAAAQPELDRAVGLAQRKWKWLKGRAKKARVPQSTEAPSCDNP